MREIDSNDEGNELQRMKEINRKEELSKWITTNYEGKKY